MTCAGSPSVNVTGAMRPSSVSSLTVNMFFSVSAAVGVSLSVAFALANSCSALHTAGAGRAGDAVVGDAAGLHGVGVLLHRGVVDPPREPVDATGQRDALGRDQLTAHRAGRGAEDAL